MRKVLNYLGKAFIVTKAALHIIAMGIMFATAVALDFLIRVFNSKRFKRTLYAEDWHEQRDPVGPERREWAEYESRRPGKAKVNKQEKPQADYFYNRSCMNSSKGEIDLCVQNLSRAIRVDPSFREKAMHDEAFAWAKSYPKMRKVLGVK